MRSSVLKGIAASWLLALACEATAAGNTDLAPGYVNVTLPPYSVIPGTSTSGCTTGTTTTTTKIQNALNDVGAGGGGVVYLPTGIYCISSSLSIPANTILKGVFSATPAGYGATVNRGTTLLAVAGSGTSSGNGFIMLAGQDAVLDGVTIYYPDQILPTGSTWAPKLYPYSIQARTGDTSVQNVMLMNSYQGIDLFTYPAGRHIVNNVFGQPIYMGIKVDQSYDVGRISNIHFWPFWSISTSGDAAVRTWIQHNGFAFFFARMDFEIVHDTFAFGYYVGMEFADLGNGAATGEMSNISFDSTGVGLDLYSTYFSGIHFSNVTVANVDTTTPCMAIWAHNAISSVDISVSNLTSFGNVSQAIAWDSTGLLLLSNARFSTVKATVPAVSVTNGRAMIQNSAFPGALAGTPDVKVTGAGRAMITGNMLFGGSLSPPSSTANVLIANNQP